MTFQRVYFDENGKIIGRDNNDEPSMPFDNVILPPEVIVNNRTMMVDLTTRALRAMTDQERRQFNAPSGFQLRSLRDQELQNTDWRESQPTWAKYRRELRDITTVGDAEAMLNSWPARPDGSDALARVKAEML